MSKIKNSWFFFGIISVLAVPIILHGYLGTFSRFLGDDYCSAFEANRLGVFRAVWYWYLNWSGRYSASALDSIFGILGPSVTPFVTPSVIGLWLLSIGFAINKLLPAIAGKGLKVGALAASALFLTLNFSPYIQQSLYWGQGMRAIIPPLILGTAYVGVFILVREKQPQKRPTQTLWSLFSFLAMFGIGGFSETSSILQVTAFLLGIVALVILRKQIYRFDFLFLLFGFLGSILAVIILVLAPGNVFREAYFPPHPNIAGIINISYSSFVAYLTNLFSSKESITGFIGVLGISFFIGLKAPEKSMKPSNLLLVIVSGILLIASSFPPAAYGMSDSPPGRTLIIPTYVLALLMIAVGFILGSYQAQNKIFADKFVAAFGKSIVVACLLFSSLITSQALLLSRQAYIDFANSWDQTHQSLLKINPDVENVIVPAVIDQWSGVLRMADNPSFYVNKCVANYYGFKTIKATDDLPPTEP